LTVKMCWCCHRQQMAK